MTLKSKILLSFLLVVSVLVLTGAVNLFFFLRINRSIDTLMEKHVAIEQKVQSGHLILNKIHHKIWDTLLVTADRREHRIDELDRLAVSFYRIMDTLSDYLASSPGNIRDRKRLFQTYYITGKDILSLNGFADFQENEEKIHRFKHYKERLVNQIDLQFDGYKNEFADALSELQKRSYLIAVFSVISVLFSAVIALVLSVKLSSGLVRPVLRLTQAVKAFEPGKEPEPVSGTAGHEIRRLETAFNKMTRELNTTIEKLQTQITERKLAEKKAVRRQKQLVQADKMASLGILVSGVAHEINNPNQFIMAHIGPLKQAWKGAIPVLERYYVQYGDFRMGGTNYSIIRKKMPRIFSNISHGANRIKTIVDELRGFVNEDPTASHDPVDLNKVVDSALTLVANMIKNATRHFSFDKDPTLARVPGHYQRLEQVTVNLLQNACQALRSKEDAIAVSTWCDASAGEAVLEIRDTGTGIASGDIDHITDPFFTTKRDQGGTGLGLSISSRIIADHCGSMVFDSTVEEGTRVRVRLPLDNSGETP